MNGLAICGWPPVRDKYLLGQGAVFRSFLRALDQGAMTDAVLRLKKHGPRFDSGTDLVHKSMSNGHGSDSGLAQIVEVRARGARLWETARLARAF